MMIKQSFSNDDENIENMFKGIANVFIPFVYIVVTITYKSVLSECTMVPLDIYSLFEKKYEHCTSFVRHFIQILSLLYFMKHISRNNNFTFKGDKR